jgi:hypothetical protein
MSIKFELEIYCYGPEHEDGEGKTIFRDVVVSSWKLPLPDVLAEAAQTAGRLNTIGNPDYEYFDWEVVGVSMA